MILEIHVPFQGSKSAEIHAWIEQIQEHLNSLPPETNMEEYDDGEEIGDHYVFFLQGESQTDLIQVARTLRDLPGVPQKIRAILQEDEHMEQGTGRELNL